MGKVRNIIKAISIIVRHPKASLSLIIDSKDIDQEAACKYVSKKYGLISGFPDLDLLDIFSDFSETIYPYSYLSDTSMVIDIALLKALAKRYKNCSYLEIGTWRGESVANVATVARDCISISLSEEEMRKIGYSEDSITTHKFFSKDVSNITHIGYNSQTYDFSKLEKKFDLIFIDGEHSSQAIKKDTENAFNLLKDDGSVIVWHDYGTTTERIRWTTVAGILDGCPPEFRRNLYHVSNTMCALFIKGDFGSEYKPFPQIPNKIFEILINAKKIPGQLS